MNRLPHIAVLICLCLSGFESQPTIGQQTVVGKSKASKKAPTASENTSKATGDKSKLGKDAAVAKANSKRPIPILPFGAFAPTGLMEFSPDGKRLLSRYGEASLAHWFWGVAIWDVATGTKVQQIPGAALCAAFSPDSSKVLTGTYGSAVLWDAVTARQLVKFQGHTDEVKAVAFSKDGRKVLTGSRDKTAILWDAATGKKIRSFQLLSEDVRCVAISPDGQLVLVGISVQSQKLGHWDEMILIWEVASGKKVQTLKQGSSVDSIAFSPDGRRALIVSGEEVVLWDLATWKREKTFPIEGSIILTKTSFTPDGKRVIIGTDWDPAIVWDVETSKKLSSIGGHTDAVFGVAFSPNGRMILTGSGDGTAILWDVTTGLKIHTFRDHTEGITSVAFDRTGAKVATGSWDKTAILWDATTGKKVRTFKGNDSEVTSVVFSPDGRQLIVHSLFGY